MLIVITTTNNTILYAIIYAMNNYQSNWTMLIAAYRE
jgi:hypothetical protein